MTRIPVATPLDDKQIPRLTAGEQVEITGTLLAGRDAAHRRKIEALDRGEALPVDTRGQII